MKSQSVFVPSPIIAEQHFDLQEKCTTQTTLVPFFQSGAGNNGQKVVVFEKFRRRNNELVIPKEFLDGIKTERRDSQTSLEFSINPLLRNSANITSTYINNPVTQYGLRKAGVR